MANCTNRPVKVVDGSTTQLPDTARNQRRYPQPTGQKPGCGFPMMRFVALLSLKSGVILKVMMDSLRSHDLRLFRRLWDYLQIGDIVLGDRAFGEYSTLAQLPQRGVDVVARLHQKRQVDFRKAQQLAKGDGLFIWTKGCQQSNLSTARQWQEMPTQITVRIIRFAATLRGFRNRRVTLVTTLLDPAALSGPSRSSRSTRAAGPLELCFRDLKTTMGMERCAVNRRKWLEKELLAYLVAHNLVRCVMAEAVARYPVELERISFKGTSMPSASTAPPSLRPPTANCAGNLWEDLLLNLARDLVPLRPNQSRTPRRQTPSKSLSITQ